MLITMHYSFSTQVLYACYVPLPFRKKETILAIMKMLEDVDITDPKTLVNFALKFSHYNPSFTLY